MRARRKDLLRGEVALRVDERVAQDPGLGEADERVVDRGVAVGVVVLEDLADDAGALVVGAVVEEAFPQHRVEDAALDGLQAVARIGQRAPDDDAHRVGEVAVLELLLDGQLDQTAPGTVAEGAVVPFPAGGPTDVNIRILGQKLSEMWGQGVVIENRPGANTGIGAQMVAKAPADGYTLLAAMDTTLVMNPATGASMNYDPFKDFAPITLVISAPSLLVVHPWWGHIPHTRPCVLKLKRLKLGTQRPIREMNAFLTNCERQTLKQILP